ncbi:PTS sugar transporter subunit IIC [Desulfovibrio sp. OttesenSCG-928-I05]|nr:PTS sugar transporter subunit IIC [Desulfovibrio sp. OttesenSCG-928-I05]
MRNISHICAIVGLRLIFAVFPTIKPRWRRCRDAFLYPSRTGPGCGCFFFALFSLTRFAVNFAFIDRPITIGLLWGLVTGDPYTALGIAVFFELFTLDLFPAGTFFPPNVLMPMIWVYSLVQALPLTGVASISVLVLLSLPLMQVGLWVERSHRHWQDRGYTEIQKAYRAGADMGEVAGKVIFRSLAQLAAGNILAFLAAGSAWYVVYALLANCMGHLPALHIVSWDFLCAVAAIGAVLAVRTKPGYAVLGVLLTGITAYVFLGEAL